MSGRMRHDERMSDATQPRGHLTGILTVEWVDAADPDYASPDPNFGWFRFDSDPRSIVGGFCACCLISLNQCVRTLTTRRGAEA